MKMKKHLLESDFNISKIIDDVSCFTFVTGKRNADFRFKKADLVMLEDALFIFGFAKLGSLKMYKSVVVLTHHQDFYRSKFSVAKIPEFFKFNLNSFNRDVYVEITEKSGFYSSIEIRLENLSEEEKQYIHI